MAYLSQVTDSKVVRDAFITPERRNQPELPPGEQIGIVNQGQFESKIRTLEMFDGRLPLHNLRVWTAEQDGTLTIRKAATGDATCAMERKKGVFATALLYHDHHMYVGMSDGMLRVYREVPDSVIVLPAKATVPFEGASNVVAKVKQGTAADNAGLAAGLIITHVNGEPTPDAAAAKAAIGQEGEAKLTVKTVNRAGEPDYELVVEHRKHTSAITCLQLVKTQDGKSQIYSGGRDWQIFVWGWDAKRAVFRQTEMWPCHQNAVRCMAFLAADELRTHGDFLFSGGDDCAIRCRSLATHEERETRFFPIATRDSVRALAVYRQNLFSATADGMLQVWNALEGSLVATLFPSSRYRQIANQPQAQLCLVVANNMVWSGGVDGVIRVWRGSGPAAPGGDWLACELHEHRGAFVNNMSAVQGAADGHVAWHLSENKVKLLYTESDSASTEKDWDHSEGFTKREQELIQLIADKRLEMIANSEALQEKTALHAKLERLDRERRARVVKAMGEATKLELKKRYMSKLFIWLNQDKSRKRRLYLAETLQVLSREGLRKVYMAKLARFARQQAEWRKKVRFAESLAMGSKKMMQVMYYRKLVQYANWVEKQKKRQNLADTLLRGQKQTLLSVYHAKCMRWSFSQRQVQKKSEVAEGLFTKARKRVMTQYYFKLVYFHRKEVEAKRRQVLMAHLEESNSNALRATYLAKCLQWTAQQKQKKQTAKAVAVIAQHGDELLRRTYKKKALDWLAQQKAERLDKAVAELDEKIEKMERMLEESRSYTDEMMEKETEDLNKEISDLEKEIADLENELQGVHTDNAKLRKDLMARFVLDQSLTLEEQMESLVHYLKAHSVNCKHDKADIDKLRDASVKFAAYRKEKQKKPSPQEPARIFHAGLTRVREAVQDFMRRTEGEGCRVLKESDSVWMAPGDVIDQMDDKTFNKQAHLGLKQVIIAFDQWRALGADEQKKYPIKHIELAVRMADPLVDIVTRVYQERKSADEAHFAEVKQEKEGDESVKKTPSRRSMSRGGSVTVSEADALRRDDSGAKAVLTKKRSGSKPKKKKSAAKDPTSSPRTTSPRTTSPRTPATPATPATQTSTRRAPSASRRSPSTGKKTTTTAAK